MANLWISRVGDPTNNAGPFSGPTAPVYVDIYDLSGNYQSTFTLPTSVTAYDGSVVMPRILLPLLMDNMLNLRS